MQMAARDHQHRPELIYTSPHDASLIELWKKGMNDAVNGYSS